MEITAEIIPIPITSTTTLLPKYRLIVTGEGTNKECEEALSYLFKREEGHEEETKEEEGQGISL